MESVRGINPTDGIRQSLRDDMSKLQRDAWQGVARTSSEITFGIDHRSGMPAYSVAAPSIFLRAEMLGTPS